MIERACVEDVAFRVIAAQQRPDHATIARFIERHETAMAGLFGEVLPLCARSGLAKVGVIAIDGTKVHANASRDANVDYEQLAREIIEEARPSTPPRTSATATPTAASCPRSCRPHRVGAGGCARPSGAWRPSATARRSRSRAHDPSASRKPKRRLEEELFTEVRANAAYEAYRARDRMRNGRRLGTHSPPKPYTPPSVPEGRINTTDPDSCPQRPARLHPGLQRPGRHQ